MRISRRHLIRFRDNHETNCVIHHESDGVLIRLIGYIKSEILCLIVLKSSMRIPVTHLVQSGFLRDTASLPR